MLKPRMKDEPSLASEILRWVSLPFVLVLAVVAASFVIHLFVLMAASLTGTEEGKGGVAPLLLNFITSEQMERWLYALVNPGVVIWVSSRYAPDRKKGLIVGAGIVALLLVTTVVLVVTQGIALRGEDIGKIVVALIVGVATTVLPWREKPAP